MADAEFIINIAAEMPAGDVTIAQLDSLTDKLVGGGKDADSFQRAMLGASKALDEASTAADAANSSLADGRAEYVALEKAAVKASKAAERAAVKNGGAVPPELKASADAATAALERQARALAKVESEANSANTAQRKMSATLKNVTRLNRRSNDRLGDATTKLSTFRGALGDVGGPLGEFGEKLLFPAQAFVDLNEQFGKGAALATVGVVGVVALTAALALLGAATVAVTLLIAAWGVSLASTRRETELLREAVDVLNPSIAALRPEFAAITEETGATADQLSALTKSLQGAKVSAEDMPAALRAAALAERALGKGGAADFIADLKEGKRAARDLSDEMTKKLAPIVAKQMRGIGAQTDRLKKNIGQLFGGLDIDPVLRGFEKLAGLFDEGTAAGQTMQFLFESVFQPMIDQAENAALVIEAFVLGFLIGMTKIFIALKPIAAAVAEFFGFEDTGLTDILGIAKNVGETMAVAFASVVVVLGLAAAAFVIVIGIMVAQAAAMAGVITGAFKLGSALVDLGGAILGALNDALDSVSEFFLALPERFQAAGIAMIKGLANGIAMGGPSIVGVITGVIDGAIGAAKALLGIASPSTLFAGFGEDTVDGYVGGVESKEDEAAAATTSLVTPDVTSTTVARTGAASAAGAQAPSAGAGASSAGGFDFSGATFVFKGVANAEEAEGRFGEMLTKFLEGDALSLSAAGSAEAEAT